MTDTAAAPALSWTTPPDECPFCHNPPGVSQNPKLVVIYRCFFSVNRIGLTEIWRIFGRCRNLESVAVAQRQRADALQAERDELKAALVNERELNKYWESHGGNDAAQVTILDRAAAETRADAAEKQAKRLAAAVNFAVETAAYVRADTEYAARVRLTEKYDELDAERDALAAQVKTLRAALRYVTEEIDYPGLLEPGESLLRITEIVAAALAAAPDPNAPSLDDFTHWPFPPEIPPAQPAPSLSGDDVV